MQSRESDQDEFQVQQRKHIEEHSPLVYSFLWGFQLALSLLGKLNDQMSIWTYADNTFPPTCAVRNVLNIYNCGVETMKESFQGSESSMKAALANILRILRQDANQQALKEAIWHCLKFNGLQTASLQHFWDLRDSGVIMPAMQMVLFNLGMRKRNFVESKTLTDFLHAYDDFYSFRKMRDPKYSVLPLTYTFPEPEHIKVSLMNFAFEELKYSGENYQDAIDFESNSFGRMTAAIRFVH